MKTIKRLIPLAVIGIAMLGSCRTDGDPEPLTSTANVDSVKTLFVNQWRFYSVTLTQGSKSATTRDCSKAELAAAGFTDDNWQLAEEQVITFETAETANYHNLCTGYDALMKVAATENKDGSVTVSFTDTKGLYIQQNFIINKSDIQKSQFNAIGVNTYGYNVNFLFTTEKTATGAGPG